MRHKRVYRMLVFAGHSPEKALEIVIEARRKSRFALDWIRTVKRSKFLRGTA